MDRKKNFSPKTWIRFWYFAGMWGIASVVLGIVLGSSVELIYLGVVLVVVTPAMIAFWRRAEQQRNENPDSD